MFIIKYCIVKLTQNLLSEVSSVTEIFVYSELHDAVSLALKEHHLCQKQYVHDFLAFQIRLRFCFCLL